MTKPTCFKSAVDLGGQHAHLTRERLDRQDGQHLIEITATLGGGFGCVGAVPAVLQFHHGDGGEQELGFGVLSGKRREKLDYRALFPLRRDEHAGVED